MSSNCQMNSRSSRGNHNLNNNQSHQQIIADARQMNQNINNNTQTHSNFGQISDEHQSSITANSNCGRTIHSIGAQSSKAVAQGSSVNLNQMFGSSITSSASNNHPLVQTVQSVYSNVGQTSQNNLQQDDKMSRIKTLMEQQKAKQDYNAVLAAASQQTNAATSNGNSSQSLVSYLASDNLFSVNRKKQTTQLKQSLNTDSFDNNQTHQSINDSNAQQHIQATPASQNQSKLENSNYISALLSRRNPDLLVPGPQNSFIKGNLYQKEQPPVETSTVEENSQDQNRANTDTYCSLEEEGQLPESQQEPQHMSNCQSPKKKSKKDDGKSSHQQQQQQQLVPPHVVATRGVTDLEGSDMEQEEDAYQQLRKQGGSRYFQELNPTIRCRNCDEIGHMARDCPNERKRLNCILCGKNTHDSFQCTEKLCFKCNKIGHKATECTEVNIVKCQNCNAVGHRANRCLKFRPPVDDKQMKFARCLQCGKDGHIKCTQQRDSEKIRIDFQVKDNLDEFLQERNHLLIGHENNGEDCQYAFDYIDRISKPKTPVLHNNQQTLSRRQKAKQRKQQKQRRGGRMDKNSNLILPDSDDEYRRNSYDYSSDEIVDPKQASQLYCCVCAGLHHVSQCARQREGRYAQYDQVRQRLASQTTVTQHNNNSGNKIGSAGNSGSSSNQNSNNFGGRQKNRENDHFRIDGRDDPRRKHNNNYGGGNNHRSNSGAAYGNYNLRDDMNMKDPNSNISGNSRNSRWSTDNRQVDRYDEGDSSDSYGNYHQDTTNNHQHHHNLLNQEDDDDDQYAIGKYNRRHKKDKKHHQRNNNHRNNNGSQHNIRFTHDSDDDDIKLGASDHLEIQRRSHQQNQKQSQQNQHGNHMYHHGHNNQHHGQNNHQTQQRRLMMIDQSDKQQSRHRSRSRDKSQLNKNNKSTGGQGNNNNNNNSNNRNHNRNNYHHHQQNGKQAQNNNSGNAQNDQKQDNNFAKFHLYQNQHYQKMNDMQFHRNNQGGGGGQNQMNAHQKGKNNNNNQNNGNNQVNHHFR